MEHAERQASPVLDALRRATGERHLRLERRLDVLSHASERSRWRRLLEGFYGFHEPTERALARFGQEPSLGLDLTARRKVHLLERDLRALGLTTEQLVAIETCAPPGIADVGEALGCLYVVEGSMLGGQVISRALRRELGLGPETGAAFFHGYGSDTGARWRELVARLAKEQESQAIVGAACRTFASFEAWLDRLNLLR